MPDTPSLLDRFHEYVASNRRLFDQANALLQQARSDMAAVERLGGGDDPAQLACAKAERAAAIRARFARDWFALWSDDAETNQAETPQ